MKHLSHGALIPVLLFAAFVFAAPNQHYAIESKLDTNASAVTALETLGLYYKAERLNASLGLLTAGGICAIWGISLDSSVDYHGTAWPFIGYVYSGTFLTSSLITYLWRFPPIEPEAENYLLTIEPYDKWTQEEKEKLALEGIKKSRDVEKIFNIIGGCFKILEGSIILGYSVNMDAYNEAHPLLYDELSPDGLTHHTVVYRRPSNVQVTFIPSLGLIGWGLYEAIFYRGPIEQVYDSYVESHKEPMSTPAVTTYFNPGLNDREFLINTGLKIAF